MSPPSPPPPPLSAFPSSSSTAFCSLTISLLLSSSMASPTSSPLDSSSQIPINLPQTLALPAPPLNPTSSSQQHPPPSSSSSRRLPPPCWSHDETIALIDSYRDKWYSLRRGNLKATHWQDVADSVSHRCPNASPPKTAVQCRHKMEKLRKRYRTELQRARSMPLSRFISSWVHFKRMDQMEKGPSAKPDESDSPGDDDNEEDDDEDIDLYVEQRSSGGVNINNTRSMRKLYGNGIGGASSGAGGGGMGSGGSGGFRIRIPAGVSIAQPGLKNYGNVDQKFNPNLNSSSNLGVNFGTRVLRDSNNSTRLPPGLGKRSGIEKERERDPVAQMVSAIKVLGDGFVRMEQMKMEMAREIETMRMEMEMKRTEMILESQQRIVEAFAKGVSEKKKAKLMPSPES